MNIAQFKRELAEFLSKYTIDNYHGKITIHCVNGKANVIEMNQNERVKDLIGSKQS